MCERERERERLLSNIFFSGTSFFLSGRFFKNGKKRERALAPCTHTRTHAHTHAKTNEQVTNRVRVRERERERERKNVPFFPPFQEQRHEKSCVRVFVFPLRFFLNSLFRVCIFFETRVPKNFFSARSLTPLSPKKTPNRRRVREKEPISPKKKGNKTRQKEKARRENEGHERIL